MTFRNMIFNRKSDYIQSNPMLLNAFLQNVVVVKVVAPLEVTLLLSGVRSPFWSEVKMTFFLFHFLQFFPFPAVARLKPLTLGWRGKWKNHCATTAGLLFVFTGEGIGKLGLCSQITDWDWNRPVFDKHSSLLPYTVFFSGAYNIKGVTANKLVHLSHPTYFNIGE
jgi:hypothetical protein